MSKNRNRDDRYENRSPRTKLPAIDVEDIDKLPEDEDGEDMTPELDIKGDVPKAPNALLYNTSGVSPVSVTYRLTTDILKRKFKDILREAIDDVDDINVFYDPQTSEVYWWVSFIENSKHFRDQSIQNTMLADQHAKYYSPQIRKFAAKFGLIPKYDCARDKNDRIIGEFGKLAKADKLNMNILFAENRDLNNNRVRSYSMRLSWTTLIRVMFDHDGFGFQKQYNQRPPRCTISTRWVFSKGGGNEFGRIQYLEVIKAHNHMQSTTVAPVQAFSMRQG